MSLFVNWGGDNRKETLHFLLLWAHITATTLLPHSFSILTRIPVDLNSQKRKQRKNVGDKVPMLYTIAQLAKPLAYKTETLLINIHMKNNSWDI